MKDTSHEPLPPPPDGTSSTTAKPKAMRFSAILGAIAADDTRDRVSIADMVQAMGDRAFGPLLMLFALPNIIPSPPGLSGLLSIPLIFLSVQLTLGRQPWLPEMIANRSVARSDFVNITGRAVPWLARAEKMLSPRWSGLVQPPAEYLIGAVCLFMSALLALPIPLGNSLPALTIVMFSLAILERDGVWVIVGTVTAMMSTLWVASIAFALVQAALLVIRSTFG